jgi:hypothetical protein
MVRTFTEGTEAMTAKTGGRGGPWVELESPKPPKVDRYLYWDDPPYRPSERCIYWLRQFMRGWRPNSRILGNGYDSDAEWFGVYLWEYLHLLSPCLDALRELPAADGSAGNVTPPL